MTKTNNQFRSKTMQAVFHVLFWIVFLPFQLSHASISPIPQSIIAHEFWRSFWIVVPALIFGVLFKKHIESALGNLWFISIVMVGGGVILIFIDNFFKESTITDEKEISYTTAFKIGSFQVLSIIFPGLSRSASTIIGGMSQKLTRKSAAEFSFFLAVPTMIAASAKSFYDACKGNYLVLNSINEVQESNIKISLSQIFSKENLGALFTHNNTISFAIGCIISFFVAVLAVKFFIEILNRYGFKYFGIYRIVLGVVMLILLFSNHK